MYMYMYRKTSHRCFQPGSLDFLIASKAPIFCTSCKSSYTTAITHANSCMHRVVSPRNNACPHNNACKCQQLHAS